jgi:hypothetical protein
MTNHPYPYPSRSPLLDGTPFCMRVKQMCACPFRAAQCKVLVLLNGLYKDRHTCYYNMIYITIAWATCGLSYSGYESLVHFCFTKSLPPLIKEVFQIYNSKLLIHLFPSFSLSVILKSNQASTKSREIIVDLVMIENFFLCINVQIICRYILSLPCVHENKRCVK